MGTAPWVCCPQKQSSDPRHSLSPSSSEPGAWEPATGSFPARTPDARSSGAPSMSGNGRWRAGLSISSQPGATSLEEADKDHSAFPGRPLTSAPLCPLGTGQSLGVGMLQPPPSRCNLQGGPGLLLPGLPLSPGPSAHLGAESLLTGRSEQPARTGHTPRGLTWAPGTLGPVLG